MNDISLSQSTKKEDYEILIKQNYDQGHIAYCPQLNTLIKGESYEIVLNNIDALIEEHIASLIKVV